MSKLYLQHDYQVTGKDYVETEGGDTPAGGISYSTEEQDTGLKWIDGKSIYQKTLFIENAPSNDSGTYPIADNIDRVITYNGIFYNSAGGAEDLFYSRSDSSTSTWYSIILPTNALFIKSYISRSGSIYATIRYTKTE